MAGARDFLASLMGPGNRQQASAAEYQKLLEENMGRVGYDRDQAVRSANIAGGFGNSTAQQFMHEGGGAGVDPMATGGIPIPTPRPEAPLPDPVPIAATGPGIGSGIPTPEQGIGSGIPMPQLPSSPPVDLPATAPVPTARPGGITIGDGPALPQQGVPIPKPGGQYRIKDKKKKKKLS